MHLNTGTAGPYIPVLHWDVEYGLFPESDGFNVWMLTSSDDALGSEGNIYIAKTAELSGADHMPEWIAFTGEGKCGELPTNGTAGKVRPAATRRLHDLAFPERVTREYSSVDKLGLEFEYVAAKPTECVIWSKR